MAVIYLTGFEYGLTPVTSGGGLATGINGAGGDVVIETTTVRSGGYSLKVSPAGVTAARLSKGVSAGVVVGRMYIRFNSLPAGDIRFGYFSAALGSACNLQFQNSTSYLGIQWGTGSITYKPTAISANTWYRLDYLVDMASNPRTCDWQLDGSAATQVTSSETGSTCDGLRWGTNNNSDVYTCFYDDMIYTDTSGDYPIGEGQVVGLSPTSDGTHNPGTNVMEDASGNDIGAVTAYNLLDDVPLDTGGAADRVQQTVNGTGNYAEVVFAAIPSASAVNGAWGLLAYQSASTASNQGATIMSHDNFSSFSDIFGNPTTRGDMSEASEFYKSAVITDPGGGWTGSETLKARIGYSGDANPDPYWDALMIELDYVPGTPPAGQPMYHRFGGMPGRAGVQAQVGRTW